MIITMSSKGQILLCQKLYSQNSLSQDFFVLNGLIVANWESPLYLSGFYKSSFEEVCLLSCIFMHHRLLMTAEDTILAKCLSVRQISGTVLRPINLVLFPQQLCKGIRYSDNKYQLQVCNCSKARDTVLAIWIEKKLSTSSFLW